MKKFLALILAFGLVFNCYAAGRVVIQNGQGEEVSNNDGELKVTGSGTAGTADAGVVTIQGVASMTPVQIDTGSADLDVEVTETSFDATHVALTNSQVITNITLDDDPTSVTSSVITNAGYERIMFWVVTDETDSGNDTSGAITIDYSYDNSTWWTGMGFYVGAAPLTVTASQATNSGASADENWVVILDGKVCPPYVRLVFTGTGTAAGGDDQIVVDAYATVME